MKRSMLLTVLVMLGPVLYSGCATMQTWPDYERSAENKMKVIQEVIDVGLRPSLGNSNRDWTPSGGTICG